MFLISEKSEARVLKKVVLKKNKNAKALRVHSVILTEYVAIETEGVCMSVCVCVCVCVRASVCLCVEALQPKRLCRFR